MTKTEARKELREAGFSPTDAKKAVDRMPSQNDTVFPCCVTAELIKRTDAREMKKRKLQGLRSTSGRQP